MSTSPLAAATQQQHVQQQRELARASHQLEQYEDTWVTGEGGCCSSCWSGRGVAGHSWLQC